MLQRAVVAYEEVRLQGVRSADDPRETAAISCAPSRSLAANRSALRDGGASMRTVAVAAKRARTTDTTPLDALKMTLLPSRATAIDLGRGCRIQTVRLPVHGQAAAAHERVELPAASTATWSSAALASRVTMRRGNTKR